jgi:triphosphoribosyl-dephospho-CoA synthase
MNTRTVHHTVAGASPTLLLSLGRAATVSLYDELVLFPKPGLVSMVDQGSHQDMDARTFLRSLFALRHYFPAIARLGSEGAPFAALERLGVQAEQHMLQATGQVNTHRGAIFSLGLLCAAAGSLATNANAPWHCSALRARLLAQWGPALQSRCAVTRPSHGQRAAQAHGLVGVGEAAAQGFPLLFDIAAPAWRWAQAQGLSLTDKQLHTLFAIMATLDDTNLAHRGGLAGLRWVQAQAQAWLDAGGATAPDARERALALHQALVQRRLSPGGAADLLAATCWPQRCGFLASSRRLRP